MTEPINTNDACKAIEAAAAITTVDIGNVLSALRLRLSKAPLQQQGRQACHDVLQRAHSEIFAIWIKDQK